ncbi:MAG: GNAT family N-acetyltransferase [Clostridiales bacterium]|nr:GNAT family N-acetyltransferase [Clostridiales bacterium]
MDNSEITKAEDRYERINYLIPDENLRHIIFGYEDLYNPTRYLNDDRWTIKYFSNIITFFTLFTYRIFINWKDTLSKTERDIRDLAVGFSNSMIRIISLLDGSYSYKKINFDFIENFILNLQVDWSLSANNTFVKALKIKDCFNFSDDGNISKYIYELKKSRVSSRCELNFNFDDLCKVLAMFPVLSRISASFVDLYNCREVKKISLKVYNTQAAPTLRVDMDELCVSIFDQDLFFLEDLDMIDPRTFKEDKSKSKTKEQAIIGNYIHFMSSKDLKLTFVNFEKSSFKTEKYCICYDTAIEDLLIKYDVYGVSEDDADLSFFHDYMFYNNKYLKYLALVISDTITSETKSAILDTYNKYYEIFKKMGMFSQHNIICWDEVIIFLLLEEGIYDFLMFLLEHESYERLKNGFILRFGEKIDKIARDNEIISNPHFNIQYKNKLNCRKGEARALILLASKLLTINELNFSNMNSAASLHDLFNDFKFIYESKEIKNEKDKILALSNGVMKVVLFVNTFYSALLEYVKVKQLRELEDLYSDDLIEWDYARYKAVREVALNAFSLKVRTENKAKAEIYSYVNVEDVEDDHSLLNRIKRGIQKAFDLLIATNIAASKRNTELNNFLYEATGKRRIFQNKEMELRRDDLLNALSVCNGSQSIEWDIDRFYLSIKKFLIYLSNGYDIRINLPVSAIYPVSASYATGTVSEDGYKYAYMDVNYNLDEKVLGSPNKIKMITDDELDFGKSYYCVPNINRVANIKISADRQERIWVNPIIIPRDAYSPIHSAKFMQLSDKDDYEAVSELLFDTDRQIYKNLFGTVENAKKVLPILFDHKSKSGKKSIFSKDNIYILKSNDLDSKVLAFATFYKMGSGSVPEWDAAVIEAAFVQAGIELPETAQGAFKYFEDTFHDAFGDITFVGDLCVDKDHRSKGYASLLLSKLIGKAEKMKLNVLISVYADNISAYNLYSSLGFLRFTENYDNRGGSSKNKEQYFKMIKYT